MFSVVILYNVPDAFFFFSTFQQELELFHRFQVDFSIFYETVHLIFEL